MLNGGKQCQQSKQHTDNTNTEYDVSRTRNESEMMTTAVMG